MKTPDEIKKGVEIHFSDRPCAECPYYATGEEKPCEYMLLSDVFSYSQQLETERHQLLTKNQQLERERDAAVNELIGTCQVCRWEETEKCASCHFNSDAWNVCESNWEWCGVKEDVK